MKRSRRFGLLVLVAVFCLALPLAANAGDKLIVKATDGTTTKFVVDDTGHVYAGAGTTPTASKMYVYTNIAESLFVADGEGQNAGMFGRAYGTGKFPFFSGRAARGTIAVPTATQASDIIMRFGGAGYGTTAFAAANKASLEFRAAENWTDTAQGTYVTFSTTAAGGTTMTERVRFTDGGALQINSMASAWGGGSAFVCVNTSGQLFASETACP